MGIYAYVQGKINDETSLYIFQDKSHVLVVFTWGMNVYHQREFIRQQSEYLRYRKVDWKYWLSCTYIRVKVLKKIHQQMKNLFLEVLLGAGTNSNKGRAPGKRLFKRCWYWDFLDFYHYHIVKLLKSFSLLLTLTYMSWHFSTLYFQFKAIRTFLHSRGISFSYLSFARISEWRKFRNK